MSRRLTFAAVCMCALGGCMVGPDFERPAVPKTARYGEHAEPRRLVGVGPGDSQTLDLGEELPRQWSVLFRSNELNRLVRRGLASNPTIAQAEATLRQAQAATDAAKAGLYPNVTIATSRSGGGGIGMAGSLYGLYGANVTATYTLDLFGGIRRGIEAQAAQEEADAFLVRAADLALTANIVAAAIREASLGEQIAASETILRRYKEQLQLVQIRNAAGAEAISSVLTQGSKIRSEEAVIVSLRAVRQQARNGLAVLTGYEPSAYDERAFTLAGLTLPRRVPVRLPSQLAERRPDIRAAEAQLHAASAQIGVATANLYPSITISPTLAVSAASLASLAASNAWAAAATASQPVLDGGALQARRRSAIGTYDYALASYKETVLTALQNVADGLTALAADAKILAAEKQAEDLARRSLATSEVQYRAGALSYSDLLAAQTQFAGATISRIQAEAQRLTDTAALFQVLGGGWDDGQG